MKNLIGGLFDTQENANRAYEALQNSGFPNEDVNMYVHKPRKSTERATEVRVQDIAKNALVGALIGATIGGFLGFLVGVGIIPLPYLEPGSVPREPLFIFTSVMWGGISGVLTGAILGVASKLLRSQEKAEVMTRQIDKRGVLILVNVNGAQTEAQARRVMEEYRAVEIGNPHEKWDLEVWVSPNENQPALSNN